MQELHSLRDLVVDLQDRGYRHQDQEREVDEGVHDTGGGIAQQGLHVDAGPEVAEPSLDVGRLGRAVVGGAPLPVLDPVREQDGSVDDQEWDDRVESQLQRAWDVSEHLTGDR